ncbi:hypothetical protein L484_017313 [Morus notabilis]|uniref:Remorin C-terminal domain-containing protein n=1 Tax=Morus notabilis TaxID=981085 RepID=W9SHD4_9ROSA|nr:hypothetical protein L484_017313 [Morus notabilis]
MEAGLKNNMEEELNPPLAQPPYDVGLEKAVVPPPPQPPTQVKAEESKSLAVVEKTPEPLVKKPSGGSIDRDIALAEVEKEKRLSYIKAWEESEKTKAENNLLAAFFDWMDQDEGDISDNDFLPIDLTAEKKITQLIKHVINRAQKKLSSVGAYENSKKAALEAKLRKKEEELEKKKAEYAEKMKNKVALIHKEAEEKRAAVEAIRREELLKAEELAAKYRATGNTPKKFLGCF